MCGKALTELLYVHKRGSLKLSGGGVVWSFCGVLLLLVCIIWNYSMGGVGGTVEVLWLGGGVRWWWLWKKGVVGITIL